MKRNGVAKLLIALAASTITISYAWSARAEQNKWIEYSERANGDLHFFDRSRVEEIDHTRRVWSGIRYKTSLMGAFSFLRLVEIDCSNRTEKTLQSTFYSDKNWEKPAMRTDTSESQTRQIETGSSMERLADIVC